MWKFIPNEENTNADDSSSDERVSCFNDKKYTTKQSNRQKYVVIGIVLVFILIVLFLLYSKLYNDDQLG